MADVDVGMRLLRSQGARFGAGGDERALVVRSRAGDHDAFAALVRRHQAVALRVAGLFAPAHEVEDACQEAFVKAYRALGRFDPQRPFRPWLLAIVANEARSRGRQSRRVAQLLERAASRPPPAIDSAEEQALARVGSGALVQGFGRLREDEQVTLALRYVLDLSEEDTAGLLGCAQGTVKSRTSRALARLRLSVEETA